MKLDGVLQGLRAIIPHDELAIQLSDLKQPTTDFVRAVFTRLLREIGLTVPTTMVPEVLLRLSGEEESFLRATWPDEALCLVIQKFLTDYYQMSDADYTFTIMDVVDPKPKRIIECLVTTINYWNFCSVNFEEYDKIKREADERKVRAKQLYELKETLTMQINEANNNREADRLMEQKHISEGEKLREHLKRSVETLQSLTSSERAKQLAANKVKGDEIRKKIEEQKSTREELNNLIRVKEDIESCEDRIRQRSAAKYDGVKMDVEQMRTRETNKSAIAAINSLSNIFSPLKDIIEKIKTFEKDIRRAKSQDAFLVAELEATDIQLEDMSSSIFKQRALKAECQARNAKVHGTKMIELDECKLLLESMESGKGGQSMEIISSLGARLEAVTSEIARIGLEKKNERDAYNGQYSKILECFAALVSHKQDSLKKLGQQYFKLGYQ